MKKSKISKICVLALLVACLVPSGGMHAQDFSKDEDGWLKKCSISQESEEGQRQCREFRKYLEEKKGNLAGQIEDIKKDVAALRDDISKAKNVVLELKKKIEDVDHLIAMNESNIASINNEIVRLDGEIVLKQKQIEERYEYIRNRMLEEQATIGTNMELEIIMGSSDLIDMLRKIDGISRITETDRKEIDIIKEEQKKLELSKSEQERLRQEAVAKRNENVEHKKTLVVLEEEQKTLISIYQKKEAQLAEEMRSASVNINSIQQNMIKLDNPVIQKPLPQNSSFTSPLSSYIRSAGTWYYPGGGAHLGMDFAAPIGSSLHAPASGIILYASAPVGTNSGYLGNWSGYPVGGGNTIHMIAQVNGTTYAFSFFHLSQTLYVRAGTQVSAGQVIALTGNSGNSTGPHTHVEVINLGQMTLEQAASRFSSTADFAWGLGWGESATSRVCSIIGPPCRMRPEEVF